MKVQRLRFKVAAMIRLKKCKLHSFINLHINKLRRSFLFIEKMAGQEWAPESRLFQGDSPKESFGPPESDQNNWLFTINRIATPWQSLLNRKAIE